MRYLAKRIERATRNNFSTYEEEMAASSSQTLDDREKIWNRIQELKIEKNLEFLEARLQATEEWIFAVLEENCVVTSCHPLEEEIKPIKSSEIPLPEIYLPDIDSEEDDFANLEADLNKVEVRADKLETAVTKVQNDLCHRNRHKPVLDLAEEVLD